MAEKPVMFLPVFARLALLLFCLFSSTTILYRLQSLSSTLREVEGGREGGMAEKPVMLVFARLALLAIISAF